MPIIKRMRMRILAAALLLSLCSCADTAPRQVAVEGARPIVVEVACPNTIASQLIDTVTKPLEARLGGTEELRRMRSLSLDGRCLVRLDLNDGDNVEAVRKSAAERLVNFKSPEPELCDPIVVLSVLPDVNSFAVVALSAAGERDPNQLTDLAKQTLRPRLSRIAGIAAVHMLGAAEEAWVVQLSPEILAKYALSATDVISTMQKIAGQPQKDRKALEDAVIVVREDGWPIRVADVAKVRRSMLNSEEVGFARRSAPEEIRAVLLLVQFASANGETAMKEIDEAAAEWKRKIPEGVRVETGMFRPSDLTASLRVPAGMSEEEKARLAGQAVDAALGVPTLDAFAWIASAEGDEIELLPLSVKAAKQNNPRRALRAALREIPGVAVRVGRPRWPLTLWPGEGQDIAVRVSGEDSEIVRRVAHELRERLAAVAGVVDLDAGGMPEPQMIVDINREKLARLGISVRNVLDVIRAMGPGELVSEPVGEGTRYLITLGDGGVRRRPEDHLKPLLLRTAQGEMVALKDMVEFRTVQGGPTYRENGWPCVVVSANVEGRDITAVRDEARAIVKELSRDGVSVEVE